VQEHPYFKKDKVIILAHRGSTPPTENTLEAFQKAISAGVEYLETDVRLTLDGQAVLVHDEDLNRIAGVHSKVSALTLEELQRLDLPQGGKITSLQQALSTLPKARFNIDIKVPEAVLPTVEVIEQLKAHDRVLVSSFSNSTRKQALSFFSRPVATSASSSLVLKAKLLSWLGFNLDKTLQGVGALQLPTKMYGLNFKAKRFTHKVLATGTQLHYWTINDPDEMHRLIALGASGIVTDNVAMAKKVVNSLAKNGNN
jgi:glycerophosphoryl diester phosphodiesterase